MKTAVKINHSERHITYWGMLGQVTPSLKIEKVFVVQILSLRERFLNARRYIPAAINIVVPVHFVLRI